MTCVNYPRTADHVMHTFHGITIIRNPENVNCFTMSDVTGIETISRSQQTVKPNVFKVMFSFFVLCPT